MYVTANMAIAYVGQQENYNDETGFEAQRRRQHENQRTKSMYSLKKLCPPPTPKIKTTHEATSSLHPTKIFCFCSCFTAIVLFEPHPPRECTNLIGRRSHEQFHLFSHPVVAELGGPFLQVVPLGKPLRNVAPKHLGQLVRSSQIIQLILLIFVVLVANF